MPLHVLDTEMRDLPCRLTDEEKLAFGERAGRLHADIGDRTAQMKAEQKHIKAEIEGFALEESRLLHCINTGTETRPVQVQKLADYPNGLMRFVRTDTIEEINSRPMTREELQKRFEFEADVPSEDARAERFAHIGADLATDPTEPAGFASVEEAS